MIVTISDDDLQNGRKNKLRQPRTSKLFLDGKLSKFSLCAAAENMSGITVLDRLKEGITKKVGRKYALRFHRIQQEQQYDTETLREDMVSNEENGECNISKLTGKDSSVFVTIRSMLRYFRISDSSFSTGKWFTYWDWYKKEEARKAIKSGSHWENIEFGGKLEILCVDRRFETLREEAMESVETVGQWIAIQKKAQAFLQTSRCKTMRANKRGEDLHYGIVLQNMHFVHSF